MLSACPHRDRFQIVLVSGESDEMLDAAVRCSEAYGARLLGKVQKPLAIRPLCELLATTASFGRSPGTTMGQPAHHHDEAVRLDLPTAR